jgi:hypothetical protein
MKRGKMKNNIKIFMSLIFGFIIVISSIMYLKNMHHNGIKIKLQKESFVYYYPFQNIDSISYYQIPSNEYVWCEYISENKDFEFCSWYFSDKYKPIIGWIPIYNLSQ